MAGGFYWMQVPLNFPAEKTFGHILPRYRSLTMKNQQVKRKWENTDCPLTEGLETYKWLIASMRSNMDIEMGLLIESFSTVGKRAYIFSFLLLLR